MEAPKHSLTHSPGILKRGVSTGDEVPSDLAPSGVVCDEFEAKSPFFHCSKIRDPLRISTRPPPSCNCKFQGGADKAEIASL